jgi:[ribosomal protein S18]-alanine N-acetyltransferase
MVGNKSSASQSSMYIFNRMTRQYASTIATWKYSAPYDLYTPTLDNTGMQKYISALCDPHFAYYAVCSAEGELTGLCCFGIDAQVPGGDYQDKRFLDVGLGLRPELVGQGLGKDFLQAILDFATTEWDARYFRATIAAFNRRSQRLFVNAGFRNVQLFTALHSKPLQFVVMHKW